MSDRTYSCGPEDTMGLSPARRQPDCRYACPQEPYLLQAMHRHVCRMVQDRCAEMYSRLYHDMRGTVSDMMGTIDPREYWQGTYPGCGTTSPASMQPVPQPWYPMPVMPGMLLTPGAPEIPGALGNPMPADLSPVEQPARWMPEVGPAPSPTPTRPPSSRSLPRPSRRPTLIIPMSAEEKPSPTSSIKVTFGPDAALTAAPAPDDAIADLPVFAADDESDAAAEEAMMTMSDREETVEGVIEEDSGNEEPVNREKKEE
ncbi:hypothetical protein GTO89_01555 [Heliobacterium gestii]|uniref:Uncharacterized protein n=1 Tax=Heliomicrobium gestii TaxID=2699 RepID=A0A845LFU0_HELGE|nr:hypothetical protein [Heliomicrobium gestii]MBM7865462.1 hypothetical protein [Heliomicrobium gestii]MZP41716.1 hypothetical protein [Heliomicrobium gestii]